MRTWGSAEPWTIERPTIKYLWHGVPPGVKVIRDQEFKRAGTRVLYLDVYMPEKPSGPVPVILWVCGGGWRGMSRRGPAQVSAWLAGRGYAIVAGDYRVSGEAIFPAQIEDCKAAARWVRARAGDFSLDPNRVGVWGDSAGGHLAELLGVSAEVTELEREGPHEGLSSAVQAVCAFYPPADLLTMPPQAFIADLLGGPPAQRPDAARLASPLTHVNPRCPPHLLVHGTADDVIPFEQSVRYQAALQRAGVECTLVALPGVGHSGATLYGCEEVKALVAEFFNRHLLKDEG